MGIEKDNTLQDGSLHEKNVDWRRPSGVQIWGGWALGSLLVVVCTLSFVWSVSLSFRWDVLQSILRWHFSDVRHMQISELAKQMQKNKGTKSGKSSLLLLDIREDREFAVSHLPGAVHIRPSTKMAFLVKRYRLEQPIVVYCSLGFRSGQFARKLNKAGFQKVYNLEGSIFRWANEGYTLMKGKRKVKRVHPYSAFWGRFLEPDYH